MPGAGGAGMQTGPTQFRVRFVLKQKNKTVGSGQTTVKKYAQAWAGRNSPWPSGLWVRRR